ncbi:type II secretion system F family protein [Aeromicrobium sp.]|uniref:type II secretion system F family protein n=1 Tax=Aeromicrobium sp. TaxID=1871063 RepID=UPI002FCBB007
MAALLSAVMAMNPASAADPWKVSAVEVAEGTVSLTVSGPPGAVTSPESIVVTTDGQALKSSVDAEAPPTDAATGRRIAYLVVDVSGSMVGPRIEAARRAATDYAKAIPDDVELGLITFSETVKVDVVASTNHDLAPDALNDVNPEGDTALYDAVGSAVGEAQKVSGADEQRLLILSDGSDTSSASSLEEAAAALQRSSVQADVVAFGFPGDQAALERLSGVSDGRVRAADNAEQLADAFRSAAATFAPRLRVEALVPEELAGKPSTIVVSGGTGDESWQAEASVKFAALTKGSPSSTESTESPASGFLLPALLAAVFGVLLFVFVGLLRIPERARDRITSATRLAEASRYRVGAATLAQRERDADRTPGTSTGSAVSRHALTLMDRRLRSAGSRQKVVTDLEGAGLRMKPEEWAVLQVCVVITTAALLGALIGSILLVPIGGLLGWLGCRLFLKIRRSRREARFLEQIPDTLQLIAGSLRAGFSLPQALGTVVREGTEPTASELSRALAEARLGASLEDSLDGVAQRMNCMDLAWVVIGVRISREVGGNLAEIMGTTVSTMRERAELRGTVRVLSAEGRMSAWILSALPFLVAGFLFVFRPGYFDPMTQSLAGWIMFAIGAVLLAFGIFWLSKLVKIEV